MSVVRCPHCKLPLVGDEGRGAACPLCGGALADSAPTGPVVESVPSRQASKPPRSRAALRLVCGVGLALAAAGFVYLAVGPWDLGPGRERDEKPQGSNLKHAPESLPLPKEQDEAADPKRDE